MQLLLCLYPQRESKKMKERREGSMTFRSLRFFIFNWKTAIKREKKRWSLVVGVVGIFMLKFFSAVVTPRQAWLMKATFKTWCSKEEQLFERKMWNETWLYIGLCWWHSCGVLIPQVFFLYRQKSSILNVWQQKNGHPLYIYSPYSEQNRAVIIYYLVDGYDSRSI